jgi:hypothetical protein
VTDKKISEFDYSDNAGETIGELKDKLVEQLESMMNVIGTRAENTDEKA